MRIIKFPTYIFALALGLFACSGENPAQDSDTGSSSRETPLSRALLEPEEGILNCAGQSDADFADYANLLGADYQPAVTMHYFGLKGWWTDAKNWALSVQNQLNQHPSTYLSVQVGLSLTKDGDPDLHYEAEVASGALDAEIDSFLDALESLARPVYLRIGYEFNGTAWNGYEPDSYRKAFQHIADKARARQLEVAMVWNAAASGVSNYMDFYPGDAYVDWWGVNFFQPSQIGNTLSQDLLTKAKEHAKPIMIGESSPAGLGTMVGQERWNTWFAPYFQLIKDNPQIKMFCYINTDWTAYPDFPQWKSWGDARLQNDTLVTRLYKEEMASGRYLHGASESISRARLYADDGTTPPAIVSLHIDETSSNLLRWDSVSGIASYIVEKNGETIASTRYPFYQDASLGAGESAQYTVRAISYSGKMGTPSASVTLTMPIQVEKIINGNFSGDASVWYVLQFNGATGSYTTIPDAQGGQVAQIQPTKTTGTNWHLQFAQSISLVKGKQYDISFRARSATPTSAEVMLQQQADPYTVYGNLALDLDTDWKDYTFTAEASAAETARMTFMLGATESASIEIDDVSVLEHK